MAFFFRKKKEDLIGSKEMRDSLLEILESLNRDNIVEKTITYSPIYKNNKSLIDKTIREWGVFDDKGIEGSNLYPKNIMSEYIKILKYQEDGDIKAIGNMIRNNTKTNNDTVLLTDYKKPTFKLLEFPASTEDYKTEERWANIINEMYPILDDLVENINGRYSNDIFTIEKSMHHNTGNYIIKLKRR